MNELCWLCIIDGVDFGYSEAKEMVIPNPQAEGMRWVLFYVMVGLFIVIVIATLFTIFFGFGHLTSGERTTLFGAFVVEIAAAVFALFYFLFGLKRDSREPQARIRLKHGDIKALIGGTASLTPFESSGKSLKEIKYKILNDNGPYVPLQLPPDAHSVYINVEGGQKSYSGSFVIGTYLVDMQAK